MPAGTLSFGVGYRRQLILFTGQVVPRSDVAVEFRRPDSDVVVHSAVFAADRRGRVGSPSGSATADLTPFMAPGDTLMVRVSFDDGLPVHAFPTAVEYAVMLL